MDVLLSYLEKHALFDKLINVAPAENLKICVVIPVYNEDNISKVLNSLLNCYNIDGDTEIIIVLNTNENDSNEVIQRTEKSENEFYYIKNKLNNTKIQLYLIKAFNLPKKSAGVGLARKIGMDESIRRFFEVKNKKGIIACLDADCIVEKNYLTELNKLFTTKNANACTVRFEHQISGSDYSEEIYRAIALYELYLHYHLISLRNIEHPFAYHTIGSAFAVRADVYAKQGGMNQKKGGEDFYFLQKVIPLGKFYELNSTCVYPSPRISTRVPFGTGIIVKKIVEQKLEYINVYSPESYIDLKNWFNEVFNAYNSSINFYFEDKISNELLNYLKKLNVNEHLQEIKNNTSNFYNFKKRFFRWFNMFQVIKYLNYSHQNYYSKIPVCTAANMLLKKLNKTYHREDAFELLKTYRDIIYK